MEREPEEVAADLRTLADILAAPGAPRTRNAVIALLREAAELIKDLESQRDSYADQRDDYS